MKGGAFKMLTTAGLIGLAVLHADSVASIARKTLGTFRAAVRIA